MIETPIDQTLIHGATELEQTDRGIRIHRLPTWVREQVADQQLLGMEAQPSGVRLMLQTTASVIELTTHSSRIAYVGADRPRGAIDVIVDGAVASRDELTGGDTIDVNMLTGETGFTAGASHTTTIAGLPAGGTVVEVWLPHNETIELVSLRSDAAITPVASTQPVWVHHGSSISHGSNAASPTEIWPVVAARAAGVDLRSLGFGGSAMVDPFMARVIRDSPADVISIKLGINVVNGDVMRLRAFVPAVHGFLDTIRDGHPTTPILVITPIYCGIHEHTPGPGAFDPASFGTGSVQFVATGSPDDVARGALTLEVIREALASIVAGRADEHLHLLEGTELFGEEDAAELPLPDGLHPSTAAHRRIGERFAATAFGESGAFAGPSAD